MSTIKPTVSDVSPQGDSSCLLVIWAALTESDVCGAVSYPKQADRSIQITGTFGGATVVVGGSNDGMNYAAAGLNDLTGVAIAITNNTTPPKGVLENTLFVKPIATGGLSQSITITMLFVLNNPMRQ